MFVVEWVGSVRRLLFVPEPCDGESFSSWVGRIAEEYTRPG